MSELTLTEASKIAAWLYEKKRLVLKIDASYNEVVKSISFFVDRYNAESSQFKIEATISRICGQLKTYEVSIGKYEVDEHNRRHYAEDDIMDAGENLASCALATLKAFIEREGK